MKKGLFVVLVFLVALGIGTSAIESAYAVDPVDAYTIQHNQRRYFDLPTNARSLGMGGSNIAITDDVNSVFANPAGLAWIKTPEVAIDYLSDEISGQEIVDPYIGPIPGKAAEPGIRYGIKERFDGGGLKLAIPVCNCGVFGMGGFIESSDIRNYSGIETRRGIYNLSYAVPFCGNMSMGYGLTYFDDDWDDDFSNYDMEDGFRHTLGLQVKPNDKMVVGLMGFYAYGDPRTYFVQSPLYKNDRDSWGLELGLGYQVMPGTLWTVSTDYTEYNYEGMTWELNEEDMGWYREDTSGWGIKTGLEHAFMDNLKGRVGYRYRDNDLKSSNDGEFFFRARDYTADYHAVSTGLGWAVNQNLTLDYGVELRFIGSDDLTHMVTAKYAF